MAVESCKRPNRDKILGVVGKVTNVANTVGQIGGIIGKSGRMEEESMDEEMAYKVEKASFTLCDNEGDNALTWDEVGMCEVSTMNRSSSFIFINVLFQEKYRSYLSMELPTEGDFNFYDVNGDGTLTMDE